MSKQFEGIVVNGAELAQAVTYGESEKCLELRTGAVVPPELCRSRPWRGSFGGPARETVHPHSNPRRDSAGVEGPLRWVGS